MKSMLTRGPVKIEAVITPLIDIAMLLVVFFALVSQIGITDFVKLNLPKPSPTAAVAPHNEPRIVINAIANEQGEVSAWRFLNDDYLADPAGIQSLCNAVTASIRANPAAEVHLRADSNVKYTYISPVLDQVGKAATKAIPGHLVKLRLAVQPEHHGG